MLVELRDRLLAENKQYGIYQIWKNYKLLDSEGTAAKTFAISHTFFNKAASLF